MPFSSIQEVVKELGIGLPFEGPFSGFCIDSREVFPQSIFFALPGERTDGHLHLSEVAKKKALAAVVQENYRGDSFGLFLIRVKKVKEALLFLAKKSLERFPTKVIAITGSVGKTTTKAFVYTLLKDSFSVGMSPKNYNTEIGLPLALLNREDREYFVVELGMRKKGDIAILTELVEPFASLITKITYAHAENFPGGLRDIAEEKKMIFSYDKTEVLVAPKPFTVEVEKPYISFSEKDPTASFFLKKKGEIIEEERSFLFSFPYEESFLQYNFLAAYALVRSLGVSQEAIKEKIPFLLKESLPGRFEKIPFKKGLLINDTYNASFASVEASLENMPNANGKGKKIAILSEMKELGSFSEELHAKIVKKAKETVDYVFLLGKAYEAFQGDTVFLFSEKKALLEKLSPLLSGEDIILIKGARFYKMETLVEELQKRV